MTRDRERDMSSQELQEVPTSSVGGEKEQVIADTPQEKEGEEQSPKEAIIRYPQLLRTIYALLFSICTVPEGPVLRQNASSLLVACFGEFFGTWLLTLGICTSVAAAAIAG